MRSKTLQFQPSDWKQWAFSFSSKENLSNAEVDSRVISWLFLVVNIRGHSDYAYFGNIHILRFLDYAYFGNMHIWEWRDYSYCGNMHIWERLDYAYRQNMHISRISIWLFEIRAVQRHTTVYLVLVLQYEILVSQPIVVYICMLCEYMTIWYVVQSRDWK